MSNKTPSLSLAKFGSIANFVPKTARKLLKPFWFFLLDIRHYIQNGFNSFYPPPSKSFMGSKSYKEIGNEFFAYFTNLGGLLPHHKVLDVGCGSGRLSIPLTKFLEDGEYFGFDVIRSQIEWAQARISPKFPNFHFTHVDVTNNIYNEGIQAASNFKFPYEDETFDFVYLNSVFTHMRTPDLINYLSEISRVLKEGGKCLITYFLLNDFSRQQIKDANSIIKFQFFIDEFMTNDADNPEEAIAFDELFIKKLYHQNKLIISEPVHFGSWCRSKNYLSFQDIIIATKANK